MTSGTPTRMAAWLESAWLARYLDRQLEGEELAWFEAYLLDKPELLEAVEVDNELRNTLSIDASGSRSAPRRIYRVPKIWIGLAASGMAAAAGWIIGQRNADGPSVIVNVPRITVETMRGINHGEIRTSEAVAGSTYVIVDVAVPLGATDIRLVIGNDSYALTKESDGFASFVSKRETLERCRSCVISYRMGGQTRTRSIKLSGDE